MWAQGKEKQMVLGTLEPFFFFFFFFFLKGTASQTGNSRLYAHSRCLACSRARWRAFPDGAWWFCVQTSGAAPLAFRVLF